MKDTRILGGRLWCRQPASGYRFAVDSLLLAWFVLHRRGTRAGGRGLELGGGSGVVSATILAGGGLDRADLVEIQAHAHATAQATATINGLDARMGCHLADLRDLPGVLPALDRPDVLYANPPFHRLDSGRIPPDPASAIARHEVEATMDDILNAAGRLLPSRGLLYLTYPAARLGELLERLPARNLTPTRLVLAWTVPGGDASRLLLEARKDVETPLTIGPPLQMEGEWYKDLCRMLDPTRRTLSPSRRGSRSRPRLSRTRRR